MSAPVPALPATMRAVTVRRYGPPEVLRVEELPVPRPGKGEVLLRVGALAVSRADAAMRAADPAIVRLVSGLRGPRQPVPSSELAGVVVAVGEGVTGLEPGVRVVGATGARAAAAAEYALAPAAGVVPVPDGLSDADAVALVEGGLTALPFLRDAGRLAPGQAVCVNGASGAVGVAAVQLAVALGGTVTAVCGPANAALVRALGAAEVVDRTRADVTALTGAFDVLFDAVGTLTYRRARGALTPGGVYLTTVPSASIAWHVLATSLPGVRRRARIAFTGLRSPEAKGADIRTLLRFAADGDLRPVVGRTFPMAEVVEAHRYVDSGLKRGTAVLFP